MASHVEGPNDRRLVNRDGKSSLPGDICFYTCDFTAHASHTTAVQKENNGGKKKSEVFGTVLSFLPQSKSWSVWRIYYSEIILMLNQLAGGKINLEETHQRELPRPLY